MTSLLQRGLRPVNARLEISLRKNQTDDLEQKKIFLIQSTIISGLLNETRAVTSRQGNQMLIDIALMKRKPITFNSSLVMLKLTQDQVCKCTIKKVKRFVRKLRFSWRKNYFLSFVVRELLTFKYVKSNRFPLAHWSQNFDWSEYRRVKGWYRKPQLKNIWK